MTSLWFEASLAVAIAVAGPMTVTAAVAVTIPRRIHRRVSSVRMMKLLTSQTTRLNTQSHCRWREADEPQYCATDISPGGGEALLRATFGLASDRSRAVRERASPERRTSTPIYGRAS